MQEPLHGYDLHHRAEEELGRIWRIGISNLYGALKRLEQEGHVQSTLTPQESHPPRQVYQITPAGRESFLTWVRQPVPAIRAMRVEFLAKLYFLRTLNLEGTETLLAAQEELCRERIARLEHSAAQCDPQAFDRLVFDFRRRQIEAIVAWLKACQEEATKASAKASAHD